jgi:hypothetical protein
MNMEIINKAPRLLLGAGKTAMVVAAVLLLGAAAAKPPTGSLGNPGIIPPQAKPHGLSYAEWSAEWWQWALAMPLTHHPLADTADCDEGQSGNVWFLGGSFTSAEAVRTCTVPPGKAIFFPVLNTECSTAEPPPFHGANETELRECAQGWVDGAAGFCSVDGVPVKNMELYRVVSPLFSFGPLPVDNVLWIDPGLSGQSVSDGYWLMLAPLSVGQHTIEFGGVFANGFAFHITYQITVAPQK